MMVGCPMTPVATMMTTLVDPRTGRPVMVHVTVSPDPEEQGRMRATTRMMAPGMETVTGSIWLLPSRMSPDAPSPR